MESNPNQGATMGPRWAGLARFSSVFLRLENSHHCFVKWSSSHNVCTGHDDGFGSEGASEFLGFFGCRRSVAPGSKCKFPVQSRRIISTTQVDQQPNFYSICDLTLFQAPFSPTTNFPTTRQNAGSSPNCKDNIQWFLSSAAEVFAQRTAGSMKDWSNSTANSKLAIAGW